MGEAMCARGGGERDVLGRSVIGVIEEAVRSQQRRLEVSKKRWKERR